MLLKRFLCISKIQSMAFHHTFLQQQQRQKRYNLEGYKKAAKFYFNKNPKNFDKSAEICWLGFAYNMKKFFLEMGYDIPVNKSIFKFSRLIAIKYDDEDWRFDISDARLNAENFYHGFPGTIFTCDYDFEFKEGMESVFKFTDVTSKMDNKKVKEEIEKLIEKIKKNEENKLCVEEVTDDDAIVKLGEEFYRITHKFY